MLAKGLVTAGLGVIVLATGCGSRASFDAYSRKLCAIRGRDQGFFTQLVEDGPSDAETWRGQLAFALGEQRHFHSDMARLQPPDRLRRLHTLLIEMHDNWLRRIDPITRQAAKGTISRARFRAEARTIESRPDPRAFELQREVRGLPQDVLDCG